MSDRALDVCERAIPIELPHHLSSFCAVLRGPAVKEVGGEREESLLRELIGLRADMIIYAPPFVEQHNPRRLHLSARLSKLPACLFAILRLENHGSGAAHARPGYRECGP